MSAVLTQFIEKLGASTREKTFVRLVLSKGRHNDLAEKIIGRLVELKGIPHFSFTLRFPTRDITKNYAVADGLREIRTWLENDYRSALLGTTERDWQLHIPETGEPKLISHKAAKRAAPARTHDEAKNTVLDTSANEWLHGLKVIDRDGKVLPSMADKHRQIMRYAEILSHLAADAGWTNADSERELVVADMGCGKGYLTFAAWHLFNRTLRRSTQVVGVEQRKDLVDGGNALAKKVGAANLRFVTGTIESVELPQLDALIALHACNTATDDTIAQGIEQNAKLIVVAPCCHKEVRPQLSAAEPIAGILQHGLMKERIAEWLTDGLRALFLEWAGYQAKVVEFIGSEHTPKNLMIAAIRSNEPFSDEKARQRILDLKEMFHIQHHALDNLLKQQGGAASAYELGNH